MAIFRQLSRYHSCSKLMAHPELDALFKTLLPFAQTMLREHGEFYPFGAIMTSSAEIRHVGAKIEDDDNRNLQAASEEGRIACRWNLLRRPNRATGKTSEAERHLLLS
jgi:hypothetical protein